ncbi:MAG: LytTR family DNA-binding domain-containing protein [Clostridiales bacterium]|nr:LytTR family DNA-binding domain-containing protein [Clostridiales bacterium]
MLNVAVCDDNSVFLSEAQKVLRQDSRVGEIDLYSSPEELKEDIAHRWKHIDVVLMDIDFGSGEDGIRAMEKIKQILPEVQIVYVTAYNDRYSQQVLLSDAEPTGYMVKPLDPDILKRYFDKIYRKRGGKMYLTLQMKGREYSVSVGSIQFMENHNHTVTIHTDEGELRVYDKLDHLLAGLPPVFIRSHKSYVVNMNRICRLEPDRVILANGLSVPISRANRAKVHEAFFRHIGEML